MMVVELTKGFVALIDDADLERVSALKWHAHIVASGNVYAARSEYDRRTKKKKTIFLHQLILNVAPPTIVDHRNHNTLDCRKDNLRTTNKAGNSMNRPKIDRLCSSQFKGVWWDRDRQKWMAYIKKDQRRKNLGRFTTEIEAAAAYDKAAVELFGDMASLNLEAVS